MTDYLKKLSNKHGLGELSTKNFLLLLEEPQVTAGEAESWMIWNGEPFLSRLYK